MVFDEGGYMELAFIIWLLETYGMSIEEFETLDTYDQINIRQEFDLSFDF